MVHKENDYHSAFPDIIRLQNGSLVAVFRQAPVRPGEVGGRHETNILIPAPGLPWCAQPMMAELGTRTAIFNASDGSQVLVNEPIMSVINNSLRPGAAHRLSRTGDVAAA